MSVFDDRAATWDADPEKVDRAQVVADAVADAVPLDSSTRVLEYGAGTGLVSQLLAGRVGALTLADNSAGMRAVMAQKVQAGVLPAAQVWDLDLEHHTAPNERFDLVVTSLVLHHVRDLAAVLRGFAALLSPGGHLCIADLDREDGSFHDAGFDGHHGFDRNALTADLRAAGFPKVRMQDCTTLEKHGQDYSVFLATASLAQTA